MAKVFYNNNPNISDIILFNLVTTDLNGNPVDVYEIEQVTIYFFERSRAAANPGMNTISVGVSTSGLQTTTNYTNDFFSAIPSAVFGDDVIPAWLSTDPENSVLVKQNYDPSGNPQVGVYQLTWVPSLAQEGDYAICYNWYAMYAGDQQTNTIPFYILGDTSATTVIPTHYTVPGKYQLLISNYLPNTYQQYISTADLTPDAVGALNNAIAKGFTDLENLTNQIIDLYDANAVKDKFLPYLANIFNLNLRSSDTQLWRRQIKEAVPLFKQKGTFIGLKKALEQAGIRLISLNQLWQVKSSSLYTDAFFVDNVNQIFTLSKIAILPIDPLNFQLSILFVGASSYEVLPNNYVNLSTLEGRTTVTWLGNSFSMSLVVGDVVQILYKIAPVTDQALENYILTLPLFDLRPFVEGMLPLKNWNVKVIEESDPMFVLLCPVKHPFQEPVVWGQIRTEFVYSEQAYNMDSYNGSLRDSNLPCDMDKNWLEPCSCCLSSKFLINVEVTQLSGDRITEVSSIVDEYKPFHAVIHQLCYSSGLEDFILTPSENIEFLVNLVQCDNVINTQFGFNRLVVDGTLVDQQQPNRSQLATVNLIYTGIGTGVNNFVVFYSPGIVFSSLPISTDQNNLLEILAGSSTGQYQVQIDGNYLVRIIQGTPSSTNYPLDLTEVPFRLSNVLFNESNASIYQNNICYFSDLGLCGFLYLIQSGWKIVVTSGSFSGTYLISGVSNNNSILINDFPVSATNLIYQLQTNTSVVVFSSSSGSVNVVNQGLVVLSQITVAGNGDWIEYLGNQYEIVNASGDNLTISGYSLGNVVNLAGVTILRRLAAGVGFLELEGMTLTGVIPTVNDTLENNEFLQSYNLLINGNYYVIGEISGNSMSIFGPPISWGLTGTSVEYSIVQYVKTSPYVIPSSGEIFEFLDRRSIDEISIVSQTGNPFVAEAKRPAVHEDKFESAENIQFVFEYKNDFQGLND